jgi:hypothetical protein
MKFLKTFIIITLYFSFFYSLYSECTLISYYHKENSFWEDRIHCKKNLLNSPFSAGSLFKIFIVNSAFYYNLLEKKDISKINKLLKESDNQYFIHLLNKINKNRFIDYLNKNLKKYINPYTIKISDFKDDFSYVHGGRLKFNPIQILNWFKYLSLEEAQHFKLTLQSLEQVENDIKFYGKSGTWDGAAWFCGINNNSSLIVICVLNTYKKPNWKAAKEKSYKTFINILKNINNL